jgi:hypothetical protein
LYCRHIVPQFDTDNGGSLSLDEYIRSCLFLQTAARTFGAFDQARQVSGRRCFCWLLPMVLLLVVVLRDKQVGGLVGAIGLQL